VGLEAGVVDEAENKAARAIVNGVAVDKGGKLVFTLAVDDTTWESFVANDQDRPF